jgi:D-alanyl-D-alanine carboxypeptidase/D-alanyl-D-alanine-endopeptidase (penicillin-binding protein 4)
LRAGFTFLLTLLAGGAASAGDLHGLGVEARAILGANQGVYVEAGDGTVLLAQAADRAVHPASVSKVPTTLALLHRLGPDYRFVTTFSVRSRIVEGTLQGDLWVEGGGDPSLVDENALLVAEHLNALGLRRVTGTLRARGPLIFDWQPDAEAARLREALAGRAAPAAWVAVRALAAAPVPGLAALAAPRIDFGPATTADAAQPVHLELVEPRTLLVHRSQPLLALVKALNDYSNNIFKPLADAAGGAEAVQQLARSKLPEAMRAEVVLGDGAGTDPRNRLSPRVAVKLLRALEQELAASGHGLTDILPVAGIDEGTLRNRLNYREDAGRIVGKTGTFGSYGASALVGAIATSDRGTVYFAILDHGVPVPEARRRQDRFARALLGHLHSVPWKYQPEARPAVALAEVTSAP